MVQKLLYLEGKLNCLKRETEREAQSKEKTAYGANKIPSQLYWSISRKLVWQRYKLTDHITVRMGLSLLAGPLDSQQPAQQKPAKLVKERVEKLSTNQDKMFYMVGCEEGLSDTFSPEEERNDYSILVFTVW